MYTPVSRIAGSWHGSTPSIPGPAASFGGSGTGANQSTGRTTTKSKNTGTSNVTGTSRTATNQTVNTQQQRSLTGTTHETGTITRTIQSIVDNMDPVTRAAYVRQLELMQGGGTAQQREAASALSAFLQNAETEQASYTDTAAREQAQRSNALLGQQMREQLASTIETAVEGAGASGDALATLLAQDFASRTARQGADAELAAIVQYGQLRQQAAENIMEASKQMANDPVAALTNELLNIGKESMTTTTGTEQEIRNLIQQRTEAETTTGTQTTQGTETTNTSQRGTTTENMDETKEEFLPSALYNALLASYVPEQRSVVSVNSATRKEPEPLRPGLVGGSTTSSYNNVPAGTRAARNTIPDIIIPAGISNRGFPGSQYR